MSPPLPLCYGQVLRQQRMYSFGRVQSQAIIDSFKHCTLAVARDCGEDLLIQLPKAQVPTLCSSPRLAKGVILCSSSIGSF